MKIKGYENFGHVVTVELKAHKEKRHYEIKFENHSDIILEDKGLITINEAEDIR